MTALNPIQENDQPASQLARVASSGGGFLNPWNRLQWPAELALVAAAYYAAARLGLALQLPGTNASPVWPPSGIGLAAVLLLGLRAWPGIALGAFVANLVTLPNSTTGLLAASVISAGNTLEHVLALLLIRRFVTHPSVFDHARDVMYFVVAAGLACAVASTNGVTSLWLFGILPANLFGPAWLTWWLGDTAGMLVLTPALVSWWRSPRLGLSLSRLLELAALVLATVLTAELLFGGWIAAPIVSLPSLFVVPWLLWAAFRFGPREASSLSVILSAIAVGHTWHTMSMSQRQLADPVMIVPFLSAALSANDSLLMLQFFICAMTTTSVMVAAAVNERRVAEQSLGESERRFRTIFEQAAVGVALIETATGRFVRVNQRYGQLLGYTEAELTRTTFMDLTYPEDLPSDLQNMERLLAGEISNFTIEKRLYRKDGQPVWVNLTVSPTWQRGDYPVHHIAIIYDISKRKLAEEERQKFVSLAETSQEFIGMSDRDFNPFYVNPAGLRLVGLDDLAAARRVKVQDCFFPEDQPLILNEFFPRVLQTGHGELEIRFRHFQTGEAIWMLYNVFNIHDASGAVVGWATVSRNIHDRKKAEAALRESEERLRLAQQAAHIGTFEWNVQTGLNTWTPELEQMHGLAPGEFGRTQPAWEELVHPDDRAQATRCVQQAFETGLPTEGEWRVVWADRSVHWLAGRFQVFNDEQHKPFRLSGINIDITERKRAEEQLTRTLDQLQQLTAHQESVREEERTRIARELHDELGQSLTGLKLELAWLKRRLVKENERERLTALVSKTEEMSRLIDATIHTMRRMVTELRPGILDEFGLAAALEWQGQEFQRRTGIRCVVAVDDEGLDRDCCSALFRIAQEALTNVVRHSEASVVEICLNQSPGQLTFVIDDNGRGIPEASQHSGQSFGLLGMRERASAIGGTFQILGNSPRGTKIVVQVPLPLPPEALVPLNHPRRVKASS